MKSEYWGGFSRHNELYQQVYDLKGNFLEEKLVVKNSAAMMYIIYSKLLVFRKK